MLGKIHMELKRICIELLEIKKNSGISGTYWSTRTIARKIATEYVFLEKAETFRRCDHGADRQKMGA